MNSFRVLTKISTKISAKMSGSISMANYTMKFFKIAIAVPRPIISEKEKVNLISLTFH